MVNGLGKCSVQRLRNRTISLWRQLSGNGLTQEKLEIHLSDRVTLLCQNWSALIINAPIRFTTRNQRTVPRLISTHVRINRASSSEIYLYCTEWCYRNDFSHFHFWCNHSSIRCRLQFPLRTVSCTAFSSVRLWSSLKLNDEMMHNPKSEHQHVSYDAAGEVAAIEFHTPKMKTQMRTRWELRSCIWVRVKHFLKSTLSLYA